MVFVFDPHLTTYQSKYWCPIKKCIRITPVYLTHETERVWRRSQGRYLMSENRKWVSWSPGTSNVLWRVTQNRFIWLESGPHDNLVVNMHKMLLASD